MNPKRNGIIIIIVIIFFSTHSFSDVHFDKLSGTDLGMGTGARAMGMSGAYTALADDASAVFWNPSGLSGLKKNELYLSYYYPNEFSSLIIAFKPPLNLLKKINFSVGLSLVNRLRLKGDSGSDDTWDGYPSQILDLSMIEVGDGFSGSLDSKTLDKRLTISFNTPYIPKLSLGVNIISIE